MHSDRESSYGESVIDTQASKKNPKSWRKRLKRRGKKLIRKVNVRLARESIVPDTAWLDPGLFPWIERLEAAAPTIQRELDGVLTYRDQLPLLHELQPEQYRISADSRWKSFVLMGWDVRSKTGARLCPETVALVDSFPGVRTAFFSVLDPGATIPEHAGIAKGLLRCHLGLRIPSERDRCVLWLDGKTHLWERNRAIVFDDTYNHAVRNDTDEERIVLLLHFDRPMSWKGRLQHRMTLVLLRHSPFVSDARRRHAEWEARFGDRGS